MSADQAINEVGVEAIEAEFKIVFAGVMGAGKTTAIGQVSDIKPLSTDVMNWDRAANRKLTTTVGFDYGELALDGNARLRLYGTPGQSRFDFLWKVLARGAIGAVILADNSQPEPLDATERYLTAFRDVIQQHAGVIGVGRMEDHPWPTLDDYQARVHALGLNLPVLPVDVRRREDVLLLLDCLLAQLEPTD